MSQERESGARAEPITYLALGDSMSIDLYPALDLRGGGEEDLPERADSAGAASLLHRNADELWPEFRGRDLATAFPDASFVNAALDGATIDVAGGFEDASRGEPSLVTLTVGGNDLLLLALSSDSDGELARGVEVLARRYWALVGRIRQAFPAALLVLTTIYDPTDGSGVLPGVSETAGRLPVQHLEPMNDAVREAAETTPGAALADVHAHFLGHGVEARPEDRWYWEQNMIEPSARGASEIRRVWLHALDHAGWGAAV